MHTLLIHQAFVGPEQPGGTRHFELARRCVADGEDFTIVASRVSYLTGVKSRDREELHDGVRVLRVYTASVLHRGFVWRVFGFLTFMAASIWRAVRVPEVDLVLGTTPPIFQALGAWCVARLRRKPLLLEVRDLWPEFAVDMGVLKNPLLIAASRRLAKFLYNGAAKVVVNSPAYADHLAELGVAREKLIVVPNGVDPAMFEPDHDGADWRRRHGLGDERLVVYAGALGLANDLETMLRAAERCRGIEGLCFVFVGDGMQRPVLERFAEERGLTNVRFTGACPKREMGQVLAASDICVATLQDIPMFRMPYPNKVFDYMAAGRPIVLGIDGVIRDVVEQADCGIFVRPGDDAALAEAVRRLHAEPEAARAMGRRGREHVVRHFHRDEQAQAFATLLRDVAAL